MPAYDEAVRAAIMRAKPFPLTAGFRLTFEHSVTIESGVRKRAPASGKAPEAAPATPEKVWNPHGMTEAQDAPAATGN
jgi:hypothetical protein